MLEAKEKATIIKPQTKPSVPSSAAGSILKGRFFYALLAFIVLNFVAYFYLNKGPESLASSFSKDGGKNLPMAQSWPWWIAKSYTAEFSSKSTAPDVVVFGSSQMGSASFAANAHKLGKALDCVTDRHLDVLELSLSKDRKISVFNAATGGAMISDANLAARALFLNGEQKAFPKLVIIGIGPRDFIDNSLSSPAATEPFRFFSHFVELGSLYDYAFDNVFTKLGFACEHNLPGKLIFKAYFKKFLGGASYGETSDELSQETSSKNKVSGNLLAAISQSGAAIQPGQWLIPANMPYMFVDNSNEYINRFKNPNPPLYNQEMRFFQDFLKQMHDRNIPVLVVGMPSLAPNRKLLPDSFWQKFRSDIRQKCQEGGAVYHDISDSPEFELYDYLDTVHLNARGGEKLFNSVSNKVQTTRQLNFQ